MKTKKTLKRMLSIALATAIFSLSLVSVAYADSTDVAWKETAYRGSTTYLTVNNKDYDPATGTFGGTDGTISYSPGSAYREYLFGAELPEAVTSGKVIVDAELSNIPSCADATPLYLFDVCDTATGWSWNGYQSELVIRGGSRQVQLTSANALNDTYRARWNTEVVTVTANTGVKLNAESGYVQRLRFVAEAADETSNWTMSVYHKSTSEVAPVYTYTISRSELSDIKCIVNRVRATANNTLTMNIDKYQVSTITPPKVVSATDGNVAYNAPLSVTFDSAIDASTIGGIQLKQGAEVISATVALDGTGKTVTITPASNLADGENYQIVVPQSVMSTDGIAAAGEVINIKAVDALYFTNLSSQYNPTAVVTASETALGRTEIKNNELVLIKQTGYGSYKFELPSAASEGVYYADMKFTALRYGSSNPYGKIGVSSSTKNSVVLNAYNPGSNVSIPKLTPADGGYCANTSDTAVYPADGVYDLRLIIMSENETAEWKVLLYDKNAGEITHGWTVARSTISNFSSVCFELNNMRVKLSEVIIRKAKNVNAVTADYDETADTLTAEFAAIEDGVAIAAAYDTNGEFIEAQIENLTCNGTSTPDTVTFTFDDKTLTKDKIKLMVWDGFENCRPLMDRYN